MCGVINKLDVRYCESCGARLEAPVVEVTANAIPAISALTCSQCSAVILPGERTCEQCGTEVPPEVTGISGELRVSDLPSGGFADTAADMNSFHAPTPSSMSGPLQYTIEADAGDALPAEHADAQHSSEDTALVSQTDDSSSQEPTLSHGFGASALAAVTSAADEVVTRLLGRNGAERDE
jgi:hypothetical protein